MKLHILASGSSGNCTLVEAGGTSILVDCGISGAEATRRLATVGHLPENLKGIIVSHEHTDHTQGVGVLARRHGIPVYLTGGTLQACNGQIDGRTETRVFEPDREFDIGDLAVRPFSIPHDAAEPVGFTLRHGGTKAGLATDLGFTTALARQHLSGCRLLVLESNHDPDLLARSPYPWELKRRIRGRRGHLSNQEAGQLLEGVLHEELETVVLAHLSEKSNRPELARESAENVLGRYRLRESVRVEVAGRHDVLSVGAGDGKKMEPAV
ncbi:MBL fold metallo-hydrolase [Candidatus Moduliflexota bacterium]